MIKFRKLISVLLVVAIVFSVSLSNLAEDIDNGYTFYKIERLPLEYCTYARDLKPSLIITMHNKKADDMAGTVRFL